jgi:hypothetical protein
VERAVEQAAGEREDRERRKQPTDDPSAAFPSVIRHSQAART